jgi:SAM-dependent methyltransferase
MGTERVRARVFGEVAEEYERVRPGYPAQLISDVAARVGGGDRRALEVGAGTGKATLALAARGLAITAVEPDRAMADVLARRAAGRSKVTIEVCAFEEYSPDRPFRLLVSAQAWHWTDPATRWRRAAAALEPGGTLALFWNTDRLDGEEAGDGADLTAEWPYPDLVALPDFTDVSVRLYEWVRPLSTVDYLATLSTHSAYRMMDEAERAAQLRALADRLGEEVTLRMVTALYLARRV